VVVLVRVLLLEDLPLPGDRDRIQYTISCGILYPCWRAAAPSAAAAASDAPAGWFPTSVTTPPVAVATVE
jgi:hypothetical protein